jgi:hypothetical protein
VTTDDHRRAPHPETLATDTVDHGAQQDIADALDIKRNQVLRQTKRYRTAAQDSTND